MDGFGSGSNAGSTAGAAAARSSGASRAGGSYSGWESTASGGSGLGEFCPGDAQESWVQATIGCHHDVEQNPPFGPLRCKRCCAILLYFVTLGKQMWTECLSRNVAYRDCTKICPVCLVLRLIGIHLQRGSRGGSDGAAASLGRYKCRCTHPASRVVSLASCLPGDAVGAPDDLLGSGWRDEPTPAAVAKPRQTPSQEASKPSYTASVPQVGSLALDWRGCWFVKCSGEQLRLESLRSPPPITWTCCNTQREETLLDRQTSSQHVFQPRRHRLRQAPRRLPRGGPKRPPQKKTTFLGALG